MNMTTDGRSEPTASILAVCGLASFALVAGCAERRADVAASVVTPLASPAPLAPVSASTAASSTAPAPLPVESVAVVEPSVPAITLSKDAWRLQASLHPGKGRYTFIVSGHVATGGRSGEGRAGDAHWVTVSSATGTGPMSIVVEDPSGNAQTLERTPAVGAYFGRVPTRQPLELARQATFGANVGAGDLALADFDSDGYLDLELRFGAFEVTPYEQVWLFNPNNDRFEELVEARARPGLELRSQGCIASTDRGTDTITTSFFEVKNRRLAALGQTTNHYTDEAWETTGAFRCSNLPPNAKPWPPP